MPIAYVLINCDLGHEEEIINELVKLPEVKEVRGVYGVYDIFLKVEADNVDKIRYVITNKVRKMESVRATNTLMVIEGQGGK